MIRLKTLQSIFLEGMHSWITKKIRSTRDIIPHTKKRGIRTGSMVELNPKKGINRTVMPIRIRKSR
jgi:hypothetical protein